MGIPNQLQAAMSNTSAAASFDRTAYAGALIVPVTFAQVRNGSKATGPVVEDDGSSTGPLAKLRSQLKEEAAHAGVDGSTAWVTMCVGQLLSLFEVQQQQYKQTRTDEVGFVYEGKLPTGKALVMASSTTLRRIGLLH